MAMRKLLFSSMAALAFGFTVNAQQDMTVYHMKGLLQSYEVNPALIPDRKENISLAVPFAINYISISNSGFPLSKLMVKGADDTTRIDPGAAISALQPKNYFTGRLQSDLFSDGFRIGKNYFSLSVVQRVDFRFTYPKDFLTLLWEGNGKSLVGKTADLSDLGLDLFSYREYNLGYSRKINEKLTVGGRFKVLYGQEAIYTRKSNFGLTTDAETFDLTLRGGLDMQTAGLPLDSNNEPNFKNYVFGRRNYGFGTDIGGSYQLTGKIGLSASIIDLGYIKWKDFVNNYHQDDFSVTFRGVDVNDVLNTGGQKDTANDALKNIGDSLKNSFKITHNSDPFTTPLPTQIYLGATYKLTKNSTAGALMHFEGIHGHVRPGMAFSINTQAKKWLTVSASYSMYNRSYTNIGGGFAIGGKGVQFYAVSDNIPGAIWFRDFRNFHLRIGLNYRFGKSAEETSSGQSSGK